MKKNEAVVKVMQPKQDQESIAALMKKLLLKVGEDPAREGLVRTPERAEKAFRFLTSGYETDVQSIVNGALFSTRSRDEMVVVKDIEFFSMCEHHLLPFFGKMHVAYLPKDKLIGLSKIPRIVDIFARRLQIQERLTQQVAETIEEVLQPQRRGRDLRGPPFLHDDARRRKTAVRNRDQRHAGRFPRAQGNPRRVSVAGGGKNHPFY